ncbi:hypothetical protein LR48_Vigan02g056100 [Vigna angularis]|uniref:Uncharacterized protein n=1 Tax=Phaseolus angularis TaxID=3914 RepID=A0A0L9TV80_PHAAN|nr:hypothetical protein LR48_Vigan02g056100 [Vigna angularis]
MSTGLEIGGLDIPFDELVVGLVGQMFNPKTTTLKDLIDMFNVIVQDKNIEVDVVLLDDLDSLCLYDWGTGVHKHIVHDLNKCMKKIMFGGIAQSLGLSGNVAVLQLNLEWYVSNQDRQLPEICAAFHMDDGGMGEGSLAKRSRVEEADDESFDDDTWEAGAEEIMRKTNRDIIALNAKIEFLTRELIEICQTPIFNEEAACGSDEEVGGEGHEAPAGGGDEEGDCGFEEEVVGEAVEDPAGAFNEVGGDDKTVHEDEKVSTCHHLSICIEIDDDDGTIGDPPIAQLCW